MQNSSGSDTLALAALKEQLRYKKSFQHQEYILWHISLVRTCAMGQLGDFSQSKSCQKTVERNENKKCPLCSALCLTQVMTEIKIWHMDYKWDVV